MKYKKPALSFEDQAQRLLNRGLIAPNKSVLVQRLSVVNYYRLSAYWYSFKVIDPLTKNEHFLPDTSFEMKITIFIGLLEKGLFKMRLLQWRHL